MTCPLTERDNNILLLCGAQQVLNRNAPDAGDLAKDPMDESSLSSGRVSYR